MIIEHKGKYYEVISTGSEYYNVFQLKKDKRTKDERKKHSTIIPIKEAKILNI
jgi:hypothetical protein